LHVVQPATHSMLSLDDCRLLLARYMW